MEEIRSKHNDIENDKWNIGSSGNGSSGNGSSGNGVVETGVVETGVVATITTIITTMAVVKVLKKIYRMKGLKEIVI